MQQTQTRIAAMVPLLAMVTLMWIAEAADAVVFDGGLDRHGIIPRSIDGLDGVVWAPFLHGGFGHLISNTIPLLILGGLVALKGARRWLTVTAFVTIVGGAATWLLARGAIHIGASIVVFGYITYLLVVGALERSGLGIAVGLFVLVMYGGTLLSGVLPVSQGVSWEGHLFGAMAGAVAARASVPSRSSVPALS